MSYKGRRPPHPDKACLRLEASFFCAWVESGMATRIEAINLMWRGRETVADAIAAVQRQARIEITLPAGFHHALFSRLHPEADDAAVEEVDETGGAELVATMATLAGLEAMAELEAPLARAGYRLHLVSPGPLLSLIPPQMA